MGIEWLTDTLGVIGNIAFGWACVPTAYKTWRLGRSVGTPAALAWNIWIAVLLFYAYMLLKYGPDFFIMSCAAAELASYSIVLWYNYFPKNE